MLSLLAHCCAARVVTPLFCATGWKPWNVPEDYEVGQLCDAV